MGHTWTRGIIQCCRQIRDFILKYILKWAAGAESMCPHPYHRGHICLTRSSIVIFLTTASYRVLLSTSFKFYPIWLLHSEAAALLCIIVNRNHRDGRKLIIVFKFKVRKIVQNLPRKPRLPKKPDVKAEPVFLEGHPSKISSSFSSFFFADSLSEEKLRLRSVRVNESVGKNQPDISMSSIKLANEWLI